MAKERQSLIRASEIGEYVYCARAWWLRRVAGLVPDGSERRERGTVLHRRHGRAVVVSGVLIWVGAAFILIALVLIWFGLR